MSLNGRVYFPLPPRHLRYAWDMTWRAIWPALSLLSLTLTPGGAAAQVVLSEIHADSDGTDNGWEFVELFNKAKPLIEAP